MDLLIPGLPDDMARECLARVHYTHLHAVRCVSQEWKSELESESFLFMRKSKGLARPVVAMTQSEHVPVDSGLGYKYSFNPVYRLTLFEPDTGSWHTLPPVPGVSFSHSLPVFCQIAGTDRELVVIGGWDPDTLAALDGVFIYDFLTATWREGARLPGPQRSFFACASSGQGRMIFVAGGHDENKNALKSALAYDVARDKWIKLPEMSRDRDECKGLFHGGKFHVIGGYGTEMQGSFQKCSESFDVATWKWSPVVENTLKAGVCPRPCVMDDDGKIYQFEAGTGTVTATVEDGKEWKDVVEVPRDATVGPQMVTWQRKLMVIGSNSHGGSRAAYVMENCSECEWSRVDVPEEFSGQVQAVCVLEI